MPARLQREKPLSLVFGVLRAASQAEVHAVPGRLRIGDRQEAHAGRRVLLRPDDNLAVTPGQKPSSRGARVRNRVSPGRS
jgi:hypothetical protein